MIYSSVLPWLAFIPLSANLLVSKRSSIIWLGICIAAVSAIAYLTEGYSNIPVQYRKEYEVWFFAGVYNGLSAIILTLSMVFQKAKEKALQALEEKNKLISSINEELKSKNREIIEQNNDLIHQKEEITAQREFIEIKNKELLLIQDDLNSVIDKLTTTQNTLANREAENRSILDSLYGTQLLVAELDLNGHFAKISPEAINFLQIKKEEAIGKSFEELVAHLNIEFIDGLDVAEMWKGLINGKHYSHEAILTIDGMAYWLKENLFPILDDKGNATKIMMVAQDISQIKNQQCEIEGLNSNLKRTIKEVEKQNGLLLRQQQEIEKINKQLKKSNDEIMDINLHLESRVKERTKNLEEQNQQLSEYAYINAHLLRAPMCSILGLVQLMESNTPSDADDPLVYHMKKSSWQLKDIVDKISKAIEKGTHFDRNLIYKN